MSRVLTAGETMALLDPSDDGAPRSGSRFALRLAGAESNFAVGLARLGVEALRAAGGGGRWVGRVQSGWPAARAPPDRRRTRRSG